MKTSCSFSVTVKPEQERAEFSSLLSSWSTPVIVKIVIPSKATCAPVTYTHPNVEQIMVGRETRYQEEK